MDDATGALKALEELMASAHVRGQWQVGVNRPENMNTAPDGRVWIDPVPTAKPYLWPWPVMQKIMAGACTALPESQTARRSLIYMNPALQRGTTHNILAGIQVIQPGEIAWAHRHTVNALRFTIGGGDGVFTVVDGEVLEMQPYDLILTPGWCWHDHHNDTKGPASWLDVLDVPFIANINQNYYEELGETMQDRRNDAVLPGGAALRPVGETQNRAPRPFRYSWAETRARLDVQAAQPADPCDGVALEYVNPLTGGAALSTLACYAQMLPPGFSGRRRRRGTSAVHFAIGGEGRIEFDSTTLSFTRHDGMAVPNWTWHRLVNASTTEPALLFTVTDRPILDAFGLYREQIEP
jgi:1-hydroxy-2-naphthoate dioxygenase